MYLKSRMRLKTVNRNWRFPLKNKMVLSPNSKTLEKLPLINVEMFTEILSKIDNFVGFPKTKSENCAGLLNLLRENCKRKS